MIAFPFEAAVTSAAAGRLVNQKGGRYISVLIGVAVSYVIALPYVALLKGVYLNAPVSLGVLLSAYCFAFLPLDIVKALLAAALRPPRKAAGADEVSLTPRQAFFSLLFSSFAIFFRAVSKMAPTTRGPALIAMAAPIWN